MKITLLTIDDQEELGSVVVIASKRKKILYDFILDTGSPKTVIPYSLAIRLQIPTKNLTKDKVVRLGSQKWQGYSYNHTTFTFLSEEGEKIVESFPCMILKPFSKERAEKEGALPIILGMDFLREKKYILHCDLNKDVAYLKKIK